MSKAARIKQLRAKKKDRSHTVVSRQTNPFKMNNPGNAAKARALAAR